MDGGMFSMIKSSLFFMASLLLFSCATGVKIDSRYCRSSGKWQSVKSNESYVLKKQVSGFGVQEVNLNRWFKENEVECSSVVKLSVKVSRNIWQSILSAWPGYSLQQVDLYYQ